MLGEEICERQFTARLIESSASLCNSFPVISLFILPCHLILNSMKVQLVSLFICFNVLPCQLSVLTLLVCCFPCWFHQVCDVDATVLRTRLNTNLTSIRLYSWMYVKTTLVVLNIYYYKNMMVPVYVSLCLSFIPAKTTGSIQFRLCSKKGLYTQK